MPGHYREIEELAASGLTEAEAAQKVLDGLTFHTIGQVMTQNWNFSNTITQTMTDTPFMPENEYDTVGYLQNLAAFANMFIDGIVKKADLGPLLMEYGPLFSMDQKEAAAMTAKCMETAQDISKIYRFGLAKLKLRSKLSGLAR